MTPAPAAAIAAGRGAQEPPAWTRLGSAGARRAGIALSTVSFAGYLVGFAIAGRSLFTIYMIAILAFQVVGALVLLRRPAHPIGWLFAGFGAVGILSLVLYAVPQSRLDPLAVLPAPAGAVPGWVAWLDNAGDAVNTAGVAVFIPLSLALFPDGKLPSPRWRWVAAAAGAAALSGGFGALLVGGWGGDSAEQLVVGPLTGGNALAVGNALSSVFFPLLLTAWIGGAVALLVRFYRSEGVERQQLKWLAVAATYSLLVALFPRNVITLITGAVSAGSAEELAIATAFAAPPVAAGFAILRYRLYDIDVVIRRSVVVGGLVLLVGGLYVVVVVGAGRLLGVSEADPVLSIGATALVAIAFQPARERLERLANRFVYGRRATPYEVLADFLRRVADTDASEVALGRITRLLVDGTGAARAELWLRVGDRLRLAAVSPDGVSGRVERPLPADDVPFLSDTELTTLVHEGGELLGTLTISKPRSEPPTPVDEALLRRVAGQAGLVLRNQRLTAELQERLHELEESRRRLLTAADTGRQQLEERLSAATGDRLAVLDLQVRAAAEEAHGAGAPRTAALLERVTATIDGAREGFADLSAGLYPHQLAHDGLVTALRALPARLTLPITCDIEEIDRLPEDLEVALWFTALEALQNASKHSQDSPARLTLRRAGGVVELLITDAGPGFDASTSTTGAGLANMRDRLAAVGGDVEIVTAPGAGTTVRAVAAVRAA